MTRLFSAFAALVLLTPRMLAAGPEAALIERVSFTPQADGQGLVVRLHLSGTPLRLGDLERPEKDMLSFTIYGAEVADRRSLDAPADPVRSYRVDEEDGNVHFRFELSEGIQPSAYPDRNSDDVLIGLTFESPRPITPPASAEPVPVEPEISTDRWTLDTIVIDAGHGGQDTGAVGNRLREKDIVLPVALKLGAYLEELLDVNVVYTRDSDEFIELKERGRLANEAGGKLFVSIHANAASSRQAHGTETFFLGMHKTEAARSVMERENEVIRLESDPEHYDRYDATTLVRQALAQSAYMRFSQDLAASIQGQFEERVGRRNRGVKQAGFYVLWSAAMPAVLVELGFITNPAEARFMASSEGQTYLASAIFRSIRDYKSTYEKALTPVALK